MPLVSDVKNQRLMNLCRKYTYVLKLERATQYLIEKTLFRDVITNLNNMSRHFYDQLTISEFEIIFLKTLLNVLVAVTEKS